jgi:hemerythrin-like domain-containing protein
MKPTDVLKNEHLEIKEMLSVLNKIVEKAALEQNVSIEDLVDILNFIRIFADKCHHGKEESILFPALENAGIPRYGGPIGVMLLEHEEGRRYVKAMNKAVEEYRGGSPNALEEFIENARNYISLLEQHIWKEDNILFNLADQYIPVEYQVEIMEKFRVFEEKEIGEEHEKQLRVLRRLVEAYAHV